MSVMSPGLEKCWRLWPTICNSRRLGSTFVVVSCFLFCVIGRPSEQIHFNYNYYTLPSLGPQYMQVVSFLQPVPVSVYQPIQAYSIPNAGYVYNGGQHQIFPPRPFLPPPQYRGIEPVPFSSFQQVETHSLPEQLSSIQSFSFAKPQPKDVSNQVSSKDIRFHTLASVRTNGTVSRDGRRNQRRKAKNPIAQMSRKVAERKQNSVSSTTEKYDESSEEFLTDQTTLTPVQEDREIDNVSSNESVLEKTQDYHRRSVEVIANSRSKSKTLLRNRRFLVILSSILARNGGSFFPTQKPKVTRQTTSNGNVELVNVELVNLPPIPAIDDEPEDNSEMMEFGEPVGGVAKAAAMKYGMNMVAVTIPAPETRTSTRTESYKTTTSSNIKPENVDYEVADENIYSDLPSVPTYTPEGQQATTPISTPEIPASDRSVPVPGAGEAELGDLPPLPAVGSEDPIVKLTAISNIGRNASTSTERSIVEDNEDDANDLPPLSSIEDEDGIEITTTRKTPVSGTGVSIQDNSNEDELSDLPPVPSIDPELQGIPVSSTTKLPASSSTGKPENIDDVDEDDLNDLPPLPAIDIENTTSMPLDNSVPQRQATTQAPPVKQAENKNNQQAQGLGSETKITDNIPAVPVAQEPTSTLQPVVPQGIVGPSVFEQLNSDLPPLPGSLFNTEPRPEFLPETTGDLESNSDNSNDPFSSDLPPLPDISLYPDTAEQDEPPIPPPRPRPPQTTTTTTTPKPPPSFPAFNDEIPPFPVTDDGNLPELPFPSSLPEDVDEDLPPLQAIPDPVIPEPTRATTARPRPRLSTTGPVLRPRLSTVRPPTTKPFITDEQTDTDQEASIPTGNNDWLRDIALKALDRGISFQQVYSINVGHVVVNSGGSLSELQSSVMSKPFLQLIQEQVAPAISSLLDSTKVIKRPGTRRPVMPQRRPTIMPPPQPPGFPDDVNGNIDTSVGLGTDFAPVPLATEPETDTGVSEEELFSSRVNLTKQSFRPKPSRNRRPSQRPIVPPESKPTIINDRVEMKEPVQPELPTLILSDSTVPNVFGPTQLVPEPEPGIQPMSTPKPFRPLLEDLPDVQQNIDPRSLKIDSFPFVFPEGTGNGNNNGDMDYPLDFRSSLVKKMHDYINRRTRN